MSAESMAVSSLDGDARDPGLYESLDDASASLSEATDDDVVVPGHRMLTERSGDPDADYGVGNKPEDERQHESANHSHRDAEQLERRRCLQQVDVAVAHRREHHDNKVEGVSLLDAR